MQPLVTVVIPVYNCEKYVERAAMSVLNQPCADHIELLIIDDGSKDGSGRIIDKIAEDYGNVRVFHKENGGVSSARNLGIEKAEGKYLAFADADDWWEPNFFDAELCRELSRSDEIDLYRFVIRRISFDYKYGERPKPVTEIEKRFSEPCVKGEDFAELYHQAWMFRREFLLYNRLGYIDTKIYEDVPFVIISVVLALSIKNINRLMYNYYMNPESCVHTNNTATKLKEIIKSLKIKRKIFAEKGFDFDVLIKMEMVSYATEHLPSLCSENSYESVTEMLNNKNIGIPNDEAIEPWDYLKKQWRLWKKHPKIFWLKSKIYPGLAFAVKRFCYKIPWLRKITDHFFNKYIRKWQRIEIK